MHHARRSALPGGSISRVDRPGDRPFSRAPHPRRARREAGSGTAGASSGKLRARAGPPRAPGAQRVQNCPGVAAVVGRAVARAGEGELRGKLRASARTSPPARERTEMNSTSGCLKLGMMVTSSSSACGRGRGQGAAPGRTVRAVAHGSGPAAAPARTRNSISAGVRDDVMPGVQRVAGGASTTWESGAGEPFHSASARAGSARGRGARGAPRTR